MNKFSSYLKAKKPLIRKLVDQLNERYPFVSVLGTDVKGKNYGVNRGSTTISPSSVCECGFVARIYNQGNYFEYSFSDITNNSIPSIIQEVNDLVEQNRNITSVNANMIEEEPLIRKFKRNQKGTLYSDEQIISILKEYCQYGLGLDDKIMNVNVSYEQVEYNKIYISNKRDLQQYYTWINPRCSVIVKDENSMKYAYDGFGCNDSDKAFELLKKSIDKTYALAIDLLKAELPKPGIYTIITDPSITGLIAHEAFGHGLEMDQFVKDRAQSVSFIGKEVASPILNMYDGAASEYSVASYFFDDEGALAGNTKIIDQGILVGGLCDSVSASILNYHPTGNGRRESYKRKAYTRMTNTFFAKGNSKLDDMIKSVDYGYYVGITNNGMEDPKNWGIQCTALYGREIKDGKFTGKIISPVVMSGYVIDLLKSISMVSKDCYEIEGSGGCGKGYKEWVRVSTGGASIKAEVKIG